MIITIENLVNQLRNQLTKTKTNLIFQNENIKINSTPLWRNVIANGCDCDYCGAKGYDAYLKKAYGTGKKPNSISPYFQVIIRAKKLNGKLVKITVDHIIPKSRGGTNSIENFQTLCEECNRRKAALMPSELLMGKKWWKNVKYKYFYKERNEYLTKKYNYIRKT